LFLLKESQSSH